MENKEVEQKEVPSNIITRHMDTETKQYKVGNALIELDNTTVDQGLIIGRLEARVAKLEDAMAFFAADWEQRYGKSIIIPSNSEIKAFKG